MEMYFVILLVLFILVCLGLLYTGILLKKTVNRLDSILKTLEENVPRITEELGATLKTIRTFTEDISPLKDDMKEVGKTLSKISSLFDLFIPDPKGLKALKEGVGTFISSIFSSFFPKREERHGSKIEQAKIEQDGKNQ
ncbi:MAG: DUF948 domain-containing protein [Deltaproteobacteria bacterium]|nr:DUF948 domain-containing protein [Deltaproteobacteria bacterium]